MRFSRGDIVKLDFNPVNGHEQGNYRPAVILNGMPIPGGMYIVLPITNHRKDYPLEVELDDRTKTTGVVLCFQIKCIDPDGRNMRYVERIPDDLLMKCQEYVEYLISDPE